MTTEPTPPTETTEAKKKPVSRKPVSKKPVTGWQRTVVVGIDKLIYSVSKRWLAVFNVLAGIYVGLPLLAPILMNAGITGPARVIYTVYSPMCHQMIQRSFFVGGEQPVYPREIVGSEEYTAVENYVENIPEFAGLNQDNWLNYFGAARNYLGNEMMGYKTALCQRDMGIYGAIFIGGLLYAVMRRRFDIKPLPIILFIIIGMGPIGLDGFSQLFSQLFNSWAMGPEGALTTNIGETLINLLPVRESPPLLRTFTGIWFGLTLVWLAYPHIEESMKSSESSLGEKLRRAGEIE